MDKPKRPLLLTLIGVTNILLGLLWLGGTIANGALAFGSFPKPPPPPPPVADSTGDADGQRQGNPRQRSDGPPPMPAPPKGPLPPPQRPTDPNDYIGVMKDQHLHLYRQVNFYEHYMYVVVLADAVLAVVLIGIGFGILARRQFARTLAVLFLVTCVPVTLAAAYFTYEFIRPELIRWERPRIAVFKTLGEEVKPSVDLQTKIGLGVALALGVAYPLLMLAVLQMSSSSAAFAWQPGASPATPDAPPPETANELTKS